MNMPCPKAEQLCVIFEEIQSRLDDCGSACIEGKHGATATIYWINAAFEHDKAMADRALAIYGGDNAALRQAIKDYAADVAAFWNSARAGRVKLNRGTPGVIGIEVR